MKEKGDECIFVGYSTQSRAYRVYNKRTRVIMESIHVTFDELPSMASVQNSSDPVPTCQRMASVQNSSDPAPTCQRMASAHNSSDPAPTCQRMASVQISSDPAPECQTMVLEHASLSPGCNCQENVSHGDKKEQVIGNPSQSIRTRRQLELDAEMCMFALTEELHQFDRLGVWELVDRQLCTNVINLKWLWKNKRDEENTVIRNKSRLVAR
nr:hypothetical protein [Tanacetum cinerariifolium]